MFVFNQSEPIWSDLIVRCVDKENMAIMFDGVDDNVFIGNITELGIDERLVTNSPTPLSLSHPPSLSLSLSGFIFIIFIFLYRYSNIK